MILNETFTDTDGTALQNHTADDGGSWTRHSASDAGVDWVIANNRARAEDGYTVAYHSVTPESAEYDIQVDFDVLGGPEGFPGVCARLDTESDTFYQVRYDSTANPTRGLDLIKRVNGSNTILGHYADDLGDGESRTVLFQVRNSSKKVFVDGTERISSTDNGITAAGRIGVVHGGTGNNNNLGTHLDNLSATSAGGRVMALLGVGA